MSLRFLTLFLSIALTLNIRSALSFLHSIFRRYFERRGRLFQHKVSAQGVYMEDIRRQDLPMVGGRMPLSWTDLSNEPRS